MRPRSVGPTCKAQKHDTLFAVLRSNLVTLRLYLHLLAATVWVGGQLTLAGLVPGLRAAHPDAPRFAAQRFNKIAWTAYGVLVVTGIWNMLAAGSRPTEWTITLFAKVAIVIVSGIAALFHARATARSSLALFGALSGISALLALYLGLLLVTGTP